MPLSSSNVQVGNIVKSADIIQFFNLFTGAMTDQAVSLKNQVTVGGNQGASTPAFTINGVAAQTADYLDITASGGAVGGIFKIPSSGVLTLGSGLAITSGGETIQAGGLTVTAGGVTVNGGGLTVASGNVDVTTAAAVKGVPQNNLLVNPGFEIWQRGNGAFTVTGAYTADRWGISLAGTDTISVVPDTGITDRPSGKSAKLTFTLGTGAGASSFYQAIKFTDNQLAGVAVTFSIRVRTASASAARAVISSDGTGALNATSAFVTGDSAFHTLTVTATVPTDATFINVGVYLATTATVYLDNATLVVGSVPMDYLPLTPADDLARCLRYYQRWGAGFVAQGRLSAGQAYSTTVAAILLPLKAQMGGAPTLTLSAVADWVLFTAGLSANACTALAIDTNLLGQGMMLNATIAAANLVAGNAVLFGPANTTAWLALEFNP